MYVPNMAYTSAGPTSTAATNFIRLAFSEPILGLDITQFNVTLSAAAPEPGPTSGAGSRKLFQVTDFGMHLLHAVGMANLALKPR